MASPTDREMLVGLKNRDPAAWALAYDSAAGDVFNFLVHLLHGDAATAEEIHQETWLAALGGIDSFDTTRGEWRGWLFGIARRKLVLHLRQVGKSRTIDGREKAADEVGLLPDDVLATVERAAAVRAALAELRDEARAVLLGKYVGGQTVEQLARERGRTPKAIESQLSRARARMRSLLGWYFDNESSREDAKR